MSLENTQPVADISTLLEVQNEQTVLVDVYTPCMTDTTVPVPCADTTMLCIACVDASDATADQKATFKTANDAIIAAGNKSGMQACVKASPTTIDMTAWKVTCTTGAMKMIVQYVVAFSMVAQLF